MKKLDVVPQRDRFCLCFLQCKHHIFPISITNDNSTLKKIWIGTGPDVGTYPKPLMKCIYIYIYIEFEY